MTVGIDSGFISTLPLQLSKMARDKRPLKVGSLPENDRLSFPVWQIREITGQQPPPLFIPLSLKMNRTKGRLSFCLAESFTGNKVFARRLRLSIL